MHKILKIVGMITAVVGLIVTAGSIYFAGPYYSYMAVSLEAISVGGPIFLSGAVLYCFGAIVEHLIAIRAAAERQVEIANRRA